MALTSSGQIKLSDITSEGDGGTNSNEKLKTWSATAVTSWYSKPNMLSSAPYSMSEFYSAIKTNPGGGGGCCFMPDALVTLPDFSNEEIQNLQSGDEVLSVNISGMIDESNPSWIGWYTNELPDDIEYITSTVKTVEPHTNTAYYYINNNLKITWEHHILAYNGEDWTWVLPENIQVGYKVYSQTKEEINVDTVEFIEGLPTFDTYTMDVEPTDHYFVEGYLVHNGPGGGEC